MTEVIRLPNIEPIDYELMKEVFYNFVGDKSTSYELRQHAIKLLQYLTKGAVKV